MENHTSSLARTHTGPSASSFLSQSSSGAPKGPMGLTTLFAPPADQAVPVADVIFVHGLNGGSHHTWSRDNNPECFWPRAWLPEDDDFKDVRIHTFGYPSGVTRESIMDISEIARSLLAAIKDSPLMNKGNQACSKPAIEHCLEALLPIQRPTDTHLRNPGLIFVAHSMGGLVAKKAYIMGHQEVEFRSVVDRIGAIFFLATPHQGATLAQTLSRLAAVVGKSLFVKDLFPESPLIRGLNEDFPRLCTDLQLSSAVMKLPNERAIALDADHRNIAMYSTPDDPCYLSVRNSLAGVISSQRQTDRVGRDGADQEAVPWGGQSALDRFLGMTDDPEDDMMIQESIKLPGSCEWIVTKDFYQSWKGPADSSVLWIRGRPGVGKSVLSSHIIRDLRGQDSDCCFIFFQARDSIKSSANACLQSMARQMAVRHPTIRERLSAIASDWKDNPIDKLDSHSVWRKISLSGILKVKLSRPQFWVIDAMDECKGSTDMLTFLTRIQEHWPLSILIGTTATSDMHSYTISEQDSLQDISILLEANMAHLPCPASETWPTPESVASHVLERSSGCFLWASIICSELRQVTSETEITKVMESTPSNMDAVYRDILDKLEAARFGKAAAKAFIAWTTYAFRPLSLAEIQTPIEMDINDKIDDVQRAISRCCENLIYVDQHDKVQLVHLTAREFFTRKGAESEFVLTEPEGHRRLAMVCLRFLLQQELPAQRAAGRARRLGSELDTPQPGHHRSPSPRPPPRTDDPFTNYASNFLFQHLSFVHPNDEDVLVLLSRFLGSSSFLHWIELAGKTINSLLNRREEHSPSMSLARRQGTLISLEKWGDDLIHLVTNFSGWLRRSPKAIHHLIPPFCPLESAIRRQFTNQNHDCLTTIKYANGMRPNAVAAGLGYFAVGVMSMTEIHTLHHREPVWRLAFAENGAYLASAGARTVRLWSAADGSELALGFVEEDTVLRWDVEASEFIQDETTTWTSDLPATMRSRTPMLAELGLATHLLAVLYRGENIVFWDCKETGSINAFGRNKIAEGSTTVRAAAFGHALDANLFAATYSGGDLIVYDLDRGDAIAFAEAANTMVLAASLDGRTLAGADSLGNFTLFEFETLRPLYRVRFDTQILPNALCFTADSMRFIELRGDQCRVWEPAVLLRTDIPDDDNSTAVSVSTVPQEIDHRVLTDAAPEICSIACSHKFNVIFCGMEDGSVRQILFVQTAHRGAHLLHFDDRGSILACFSRPKNPRRQGMWEIGPLLIESQIEGQGALAMRQILMSSRHERLLLITETEDTLWPVPLEQDGAWIQRLKSESKTTGSQWMTRQASKSDLLLFIGENSEELKVYDWETLSQLQVIPLSVDHGVSIRRFAPLCYQGLFATYTTKTASPPGALTASKTPKQANSILLWDCPNPEDETSTLTPRQDLTFLPSCVEHIIGTFKNRLVLYMADHWISSVELQQRGSIVEGSFLRHFFLPNDWIGFMVVPNMIFGLGPEGEILIARRSELAVIKRGLEVTEDGGMARPSRPNNSGSGNRLRPYPSMVNGYL
ncbi:vegetative incompatibility protein HET-E-1 [Staphylotrichum tortipilum]|uniref:Vegetative incompatibility protein HET-E-1 n=1 Tax=Staphylotrichum tortipilum TaxID=2831512 RepID=A0AAN6RQH1_9PEZI|nr:vegetative incompatibility protein HET-E-1 [Staphylotrichum longicolle]